jgi:hypothetical protein
MRRAVLHIAVEVVPTSEPAAQVLHLPSDVQISRFSGTSVAP